MRASVGSKKPLKQVWDKSLAGNHITFLQEGIQHAHKHTRIHKKHSSSNHSKQVCHNRIGTIPNKPLLRDP